MSAACKRTFRKKWISRFCMNHHCWRFLNIFQFSRRVYSERFTVRVNPWKPVQWNLLVQGKRIPCIQSFVWSTRKSVLVDIYSIHVYRVRFLIFGLKFFWGPYDTGRAVIVFQFSLVNLILRRWVDLFVSCCEILNHYSHFHSYFTFSSDFHQFPS